MDKPDALRLADAIDPFVRSYAPDHLTSKVAAAELRRLHAENERLAAEVANRNRRALDGDEAVSALANVHAYYEKLEAQRDALLEALKWLDRWMSDKTMPECRWKVRGTIEAVERENHAKSL